MKYLPFKVTEYNELNEDKEVILHSDSGQLWVRVGNVDINIKQSDDGLGLYIEALDAELCEQELGSMQVWYEDVEKLPLNKDGSHPLS